LYVPGLLPIKSKYRGRLLLTTLTREILSIVLSVSAGHVIVPLPNSAVSSSLIYPEIFPSGLV